MTRQASSLLISLILLSTIFVSYLSASAVWVGLYDEVVADEVGLASDESDFLFEVGDVQVTAHNPSEGLVKEPITVTTIHD